jgi:hypothetical protein
MPAARRDGDKTRDISNESMPAAVAFAGAHKLHSFQIFIDRPQFLAAIQHARF